jgi:nucleoside-diphosphate-sugar epimerase
MGGFFILFSKMKVSIIGLGWLGFPLAKSLQSKGFTVIGSTTSLEKKDRIEKLGITSVLLEMAPHPIGLGFHPLFDADILIITIPPKSRQQSVDFYLEQLKYLKSMITNSKVKRIIFISSTSIYPEDPRRKEYLESEPLNLENTGNQIQLRGESLLQGSKDYELTIIRFGGLMGGNRIPGKYFAGKENVLGHTRVNFIHILDAIGIVEWVILKGLWNETFNGVAPFHPFRKEIYEKNVIEYGLESPKSYSTGIHSLDRLISSQKIQDSGYQFKNPNPLDFRYDLNESI